MKPQEALEIVDRILHPQSLSDVQELVFNGVWSGKTYEQIAASSSYETEYMRHVGSQLWRLLSQKLGQKVTKSNCHSVLRRVGGEEDAKRDSSADRGAVDWGEAPDVSDFYGRGAELKTLKEWLVVDRCLAIAILGMGGIGKTALSVKLAQQVAGEFEFLIWRSLRNAPPLEDLLADLVQLMSHQQVVTGSTGQLLQCLRNSRSLLILDNWETILQSGQTGVYRSGYEEYGDLLRAIGETSHSSSLIVTSREKPPEIAIFEGGEARSLYLKGDRSAALALVEAKGLVGSVEEKQLLGDRYGNSPLAIKIVATSVRDLFDGAVADFLAQDTIAFNGVRRLLDWQFQRLSALEQSIMYWLAINRDWTTIDELHADILPPVSKIKLLEALEGLIWRSLIEQQGGRYTQQPVVMEYVSDRLVDLAIRELIEREFSLVATHAFLKTTVKDYIRESQERLILRPIAEGFFSHFGDKATLKGQLTELIDLLRRSSSSKVGYSGGNLINLCVILDIDLTGWDFSALNLSHAYLQDLYLRRVNFAGANLAKAIFAHTFGIVFSLAFAPSTALPSFPQAQGNLLAAGDCSGKAIIWQTSNGQPLLTLIGHTNLVLSVSWSSDGQFLATSSADCTIRIWHVKTGECDRILLGHQNWVWSVAWSPDGQQIASGSADRAVKLWDARTGECLSTLAHQAPVQSVAWSPDGQTLATGDADRLLRLWNPKTGACIKQIAGHNDVIWCVAWHPTGKLIATGADDRAVKIWDAATGNCCQTLKGHEDTVCTIAWDLDGQMLASSSRDCTIRLWNVAEGQCQQVLAQHSAWVWAVSWSSDCQYLATGSHDCTVRLWDAATGVCLKTVQGYQGTVRSVSWSPHGKIIATGSYDGIARLWDAATGECCQTLTDCRGLKYPVWSARIRSASWSPDGKMLATASDDCLVRLWNVETGECERILAGHTNALWSVGWSWDGKIVASASHDTTIGLWDANSGKCLRRLRGHVNWVFCVAWSPDRELLASGGEDSTVRVWDASSGECLAVWQRHQGWVWAIAWSPNGRYIATGSADCRICIWDVEAGVCLKEMQGHRESVRSIGWSPDSQKIASCSDDRTIRLWNLASGKCDRVLEGHVGAVVSLSWSPDGQTIASGSTDETVRIWDAMTGECQRTLRADRLYEGTNISGARGLTPAQLTALRALGAIEETRSQSPDKGN
jgi:WD40 repeat protein